MTGNPYYQPNYEDYYYDPPWHDKVFDLEQYHHLNEALRAGARRAGPLFQAAAIAAPIATLGYTANELAKERDQQRRTRRQADIREKEQRKFEELEDEAERLTIEEARDAKFRDITAREREREREKAIRQREREVIKEQRARQKEEDANIRRGIKAKHTMEDRTRLDDIIHALREPNRAIEQYKEPTEIVRKGDPLYIDDMYYDYDIDAPFHKSRGSPRGAPPRPSQPAPSLQRKNITIDVKGLPSFIRNKRSQGQAIHDIDKEANAVMEAISRSGIDAALQDPSVRRIAPRAMHALENPREALSSDMPFPKPFMPLLSENTRREYMEARDLAKRMQRTKGSVVQSMIVPPRKRSRIVEKRSRGSRKSPVTGDLGTTKRSSH
jgi:hypothetical protein